MTMYKIVLLFAACMLFMAAFAHPMASYYDGEQPVPRDPVEETPECDSICEEVNEILNYAAWGIYILLFIVLALEILGICFCCLCACFSKCRQCCTQKGRDVNQNQNQNQPRPVVPPPAHDNCSTSSNSSTLVLKPNEAKELPHEVIELSNEAIEVSNDAVELSIMPPSNPV